MMVVLNLFGPDSDRKVLSVYNDSSDDAGGAKEYPGFIVGTGDDDTILSSFFVDNKLINVYASATKNTQPSITEYGLSATSYDLPTVVRFNESYSVTVFITPGTVSRDSTVLCGGTDNHLIFIPHTISGGNLVSGDPVCYRLGGTKQNPGIKSRRTVAVPHIEDGKIFVLAPYQVFKFEFCNTILYSHFDSSLGELASVALASVNANTLECLTAQSIEPTKDHRVRGMVGLENNTFAFTEFVAATSGSSPSSWIAKTRYYKYVRCEDGAIDLDTNECVCYGTGYECDEHKPPVSSSSDPCISSSSPVPSSSSPVPSSSSPVPSSSSPVPSSSSPVPSSSSPVPSSSIKPTSSSSIYSSSVRPSPYSSSGCSSSSSKGPNPSELTTSDESDVDNSLFIASIVLLVFTVVFLISAVVFIVLFFVSK